MPKTRKQRQKRKLRAKGISFQVRTGEIADMFRRKGRLTPKPKTIEANKVK